MKKRWTLLLLLAFPVMMASAQVKGNLSASTKMFLQRYQSGVVRKAPVKRDRGDLQLGMAETDSHDLLPETETRGGTGEYHLRKIVISTFCGKRATVYLFFSFANYIAP